MNIQMMDPNTLIPWPGNPKNHPPEQVTAIARSIKEFGWDQPIVVNDKLEIIKGHGRRLAALELGMTSVPVIVSKNSGQHIDRLNRILDNHLTSQEYDPVLLREDLLNLQDKGKLGMSLFDENMIPQVAQMTTKAAASLFSLLTKHKCPSCSYRW